MQEKKNRREYQEIYTSMVSDNLLKGKTLFLPRFSFPLMNQIKNFHFFLCRRGMKTTSTDSKVGNHFRKLLLSGQMDFRRLIRNPWKCFLPGVILQVKLQLTTVLIGGCAQGDRKIGTDYWKRLTERSTYMLSPRKLDDIKSSRITYLISINFFYNGKRYKNHS